MVLHGAISLVFLAILILVLIKPFGLHRRLAQSGEIGDPVTRACLRQEGHRPVAILPPSEAAPENQEGM
jgi:hypothetical protein